MENESPIINILTYKLPFDLANQIFNEFQIRFKDAKYLIATYKTYKPLAPNIKTVELLLSLSIFHKRVISNLDGAVKFYSRVSKKSTADTISIGGYKLTFEEKNKILAVVLNYEKLLSNFSIHPKYLEYSETNEFLKKIIILKSTFKNDSKKNKLTKGGSKDRSIEDDLPF